MYRILQCDKDTVITDKYIKASRSIDANTGNAGTLDIYKLYNQTYVSGSTDVYEKTRALIHFDLSPLRALTGSTLNIADPSFKCYLSLANIYHGQPVPSNFTISIYPLARTFSEGRGFDVVSYQNKDAANWITASVTNGTPDLWGISGSNLSGTLGTSGVDFYTSLPPSSGSVPLFKTITFNRGDEDLYVDVTTLVSSTLANILPDYGFRLSLTESQDTNQNTYFVKRFSSRHAKNPFKRPVINVYYDNSFIDNQSNAFTEITNTFAIYNKYFGQYRNFYSGSAQITGSNCLMFNMIASRSLTVWTGSYSVSHSKSINCLTSSTIYYSASFTGSQLSIAGFYSSGAYVANPVFNPNSIAWKTFADATDWRGNGKITDITFATEWKSLDQTLLYTSGSEITIKRIVGQNSNVFERNYIVNVTNLKPNYFSTENARMRVFIQDFNTDMKYYKLPHDLTSGIYSNMHWRIINPYTKEVVVPFETGSNSTKLSADGSGMYFDMFMSDLPVGQVYELEFLIREDNKDYYVMNQGFKFRIDQ